MQKREKILALAAVGLVVVLLANWGIGKLLDQFSNGRNSINSLNDQINKQQVELRRVQKAMAKRAEWERRSLPTDPQSARALYQAWLIQTVERSGISEPVVTRMPETGSRASFQKYVFSVNGKATLEQLVRFMYEFHRADHLHLIRNLSANPIAEKGKTKLLDLKITIDAVSLPKGERPATLSDRISDRLKLKDAGEYLATILPRNPYAPANRPPVFPAIAVLPKKIGLPVTFSAKASDPDAQDKVRYSLDGGAPAGAKIDPSSGAFTWDTSKNVKPGEYSVTIRATDDGVPALNAPQTVKITLTPGKLALAKISDQTVELGKSLSLSAKLEEVHGYPVTYVLGEGAPTGAKLDSKTGGLSWTPAESDLGKSFDFTVKASDVADAPQTDAKSFKVAVIEPKPQVLVLNVDARHTFVVGILRIDGEYQAWLRVFTTEERFVVREGDRVKAGNFSGAIERITPEQVEFNAAGRKIVVPLGKNLSDGLTPVATGL